MKKVLRKTFLQGSGLCFLMLIILGGGSLASAETSVPFTFFPDTPAKRG